MTTTPAMIRPMPISAGVSRCCLKTSAPTMEISTMPTLALVDYLRHPGAPKPPAENGTA